LPGITSSGIDDVTQQPVFAGAAMVGEVTGRNDDVGTLGEPIQVANGGLELGIRIHETAHELAVIRDVKIRDLRNEHDDILRGRLALETGHSTARRTAHHSVEPTEADQVQPARAAQMCRSVLSRRRRVGSCISF
jgi:hypothetical protein